MTLPDNVIPLPTDFETTGLHPIEDTILELGLILVERDLSNPIEFGSRVVHATEEQLARMGDYVTQMHTENGLLDEVRASTLTLSELDDEITEWLAGHGHTEHEDPNERTAVMLGSSCRLDLDLIEFQMPRLSKVMHYRMIDTSGMREALAMWLPNLYLPETSVFEVFADYDQEPIGHRALHDARWTLADARNIRTALSTRDIPTPF